MIPINKKYDNHLEVKQAWQEFESFQRNYLKYPENIDINSRFVEVDLEFRIDKDNHAFDISPSSIVLDRPRTLHQTIKHTKTKNSDFVECAINLVREFKNWKAHRIDTRYVNNINFITISFSYHIEYFSSNSFVINPKVKAYYINKTDNYERIIENKYGCDGIMNVLSIVEIDGTLTNLEVIGHEGKISGIFALEELKKLGNWEPAKYDNRNVRSQLDILIYI